MKLDQNESTTYIQGQLGVKSKSFGTTRPPGPGTELNARDLGTRSKMADKREDDHRILETVYFAALKHKDQRRKDPEKTPYINHPIGVAYILWKEGGVHDMDVLQVIKLMLGPHIYSSFTSVVESGG